MKPLFTAALLICLPVQAAQLSGVVQTALVSADDSHSWQNDGTGLLRHDDNGIALEQSLIRLEQTLNTDFSLDIVANYHADGEQHLGLTQALLQYKPLSAGTVKFKARAGFFYPQMSLENLDTGWLSPYHYTQSAINSWLGEELRIAGLEMSLYSPGRQRRSPWSWELYVGAFRGNDPLGTLISWRGLALHDRQSLHNDRVEFAPYPSVVDPSRINHPDWVEPFHEIDGKTGGYAGLHLSYFQRFELRYYFYDNRANPLAVNAQRLYAWHTRFHSLATSYQLTAETKFIAQWMQGDTEMGPRGVEADFDAWYLLLTHHIAQHRLSLRLDRFMVREDDIWPWDYNDSDGRALTLSWRYDLSSQWQLGLEQHFNQSTVVNRATVGENMDTEQNQTLAIVQFRW
ncbi:hypothetical protein P2G88_14525 [Aliiglaciecola sp. CAU 1673]|uniref:hypothetical protein n=1 Tax=Aliiglaciecola sp. CAU 1673 TaxID=3032595 RepID=UPI0023DBC7D4|nr:hypothetical protein [Aliiglaciecola sp. CAU 1673]MDF2179466.1 hypothetical protein [Aliiglaciecola sp. CAU 1673]